MARQSWFHQRSLTCLLLLFLSGVVEGQTKKNIQDLNYRVFPKRTVQEAAVLEWGNSAIITALDASVAHFGPQTKDAALLEVETRPILAKPLNGVHDADRQALRDEGTPLPVKALENADDVVGSMVIMTNEGGLSGVQLAKVAQESGAAALLVVNYDSVRPDDIYRLPADDETAAEIEIPVVMISLNSANLLASATYEADSRRSPPSRLTNKYLPERVRLYAGDDRPFFEDVEASQPTVYLIHDLLTSKECDALVAQAERAGFEPLNRDDSLQHSSGAPQSHQVDRVTLWQGLLQFPAQKAVEERIEQVTAFPSNHFSDFVVDRFQAGSYVQPQYDVLDDRLVPVASISIFLSPATNGGGEIVYPSTAHDDPVKVMPRQGLAVVHHNTDERGHFDTSSQHAVLPLSEGPYYIAHKYIYMEPISYARRLALPALALPFGGKLPGVVLQLHAYMVEQFGPDQGEDYFNKVCVFVPVLIVLLIAQFVVDRVRGKPAKKDKDTGEKKKQS